GPVPAQEDKSLRVVVLTAFPAPAAVQSRLRKIRLRPLGGDTEYRETNVRNMMSLNNLWTKYSSPVKSAQRKRMFGTLFSPAGRTITEQVFHDAQASARCATFGLHPYRLVFTDTAYLAHETWIPPAFQRLRRLHGMG